MGVGPSITVFDWDHAVILHLACADWRCFLWNWFDKEPVVHVVPVVLRFHHIVSWRDGRIAGLRGGRHSQSFVRILVCDTY